MKNEIEHIREELATIRSRNKRVELDKAWELSWTRRTLVALITYGLIVILMVSLGLDKPYIAAIIPSLAYLISMSALPFIKKWWIKRQ